MRRLLPVLILLAALPLGAKKPRKVRLLAWAPPPAPWTVTDYQLSAKEGGIEVRLSYLPMGARGNFFKDKTGNAADPFANDATTLLFQLEIVNTSAGTVTVEPGMFQLAGEGLTDAPWSEVDYLSKFKDLGEQERDELRRTYLTQKVEVPPNSKLSRAMAFDAQALDREVAFRLSAQNLPIGMRDGRALAIFVMRWIRVRLGPDGRPLPEAPKP